MYPFPRELEVVVGFWWVVSGTHDFKQTVNSIWVGNDILGLKKRKLCILEDLECLLISASIMGEY